jgi:hypothetical protein
VKKAFSFLVLTAEKEGRRQTNTFTIPPPLETNF